MSIVYFLNMGGKDKGEVKMIEVFSWGEREVVIFFVEVSKLRGVNYRVTLLEFEF